MKNTHIADHVEHFDSDPFNLEIKRMTPNKLVWEWAVAFRDPESDNSPFMAKKFGFNTKEEAEGYLRGWNDHRNIIKEMLLRERLKRAK